MCSIAFVDDDENFLNIMKEYIKRYSEEENAILSVHFFSDGDEIVSDYNAVYDIIFLDVEMKRMNGMTAAKQIREFDNEVVIIFITNSAQHAINGYSVGAMDYLLKPISYFSFSQQLKKTIKLLSHKEKIYLLLPTDNGAIKVASDEIFFIESFKRKLIVHTVSGDYEIVGTLKHFEDKLSEKKFFRCNNCYLVNLNHVKGIKDMLITVDKFELYVSRARKKAFFDALTEYVGGL